MSEPVINVENLSKRYVIGHKRAPTEGIRHVVESAMRAPFRWLRSRREEKKQEKEEFWALKNVSFEVKQGEVLGLIGRNGAGKSTLLKILSRITEPTVGRFHLCGRVASLLEVGTGFHPELTGRENIFLNGAILGMQKVEIKKKFDEIVAFSEIEKFLDTPVKRYSSGMHVRLAFSVAAHLDSEILIIDEVLAVGDAAFQKKCLGKMEEARRHDRTVLFVSHNLGAVESFCTRGVVMENGKVAFTGPCKDALNYHLKLMPGERIVERCDVINLALAPGRPERFRPQLQKLELFDREGKPFQGRLSAGDGLRAKVTVELESASSRVDVELAFFKFGGPRVCTAHSAYEPNRSQEPLLGRHVFECDIPTLPLVPGEYRIHVGLDVLLSEADYVEDAARLTVVQSDYYGTGIAPITGTFMLNNRWAVRPD
jgi:lipopolysaccharide transport system ATP-binding protein